MYTEQIERGVQLLGASRIAQIDTHVLDMQNSDWCVLAQCFGSYVQGLHALNMRQENFADRYHYGFSVDELGVDNVPRAFKVLTIEWKRAIIKARNSLNERSVGCYA